jgi:hypothetical protein
MLIRTNFTVSAMALVLCSITGVLCSNVAHADPAYGGVNRISRDIMRSLAKREVEQMGRYGTDSALGQMLDNPPLPGDQSFTDSSSDPNKYLAKELGSIPDFGANERKNVSITLPAMKGLRQILDSSVTKDLLKQLTSAESSVLMQTYMMVENGAATGFMGSMNIGSNLMSNLLQTQDYQLKLMDMTDSTGKMKEAYVKKVAEYMQKEQYQDVWPAALYMASGEDGQAGNGKMKDLNLGKEAFDLSSLPYESDMMGPPNPKQRNLSDMLFSKGNDDTSGGATAYKNEKIQNLRKDFIELVGDVSIQIENQGNSKAARNLTYTFVAPQFDKDKKRRGVAATNWEEVQVVWENMNSILADLCKWKKENTNYQKEVGKMETSATTKDIGKDTADGSPWELASAPDTPFTMNVVEQLYTLVQKDRPQSDLNCEELRLKADKIPDDGAASDSANFNDCTDPNGGGCLRNRVILHLAFLTARSRTLHTYRMLYSISKRFATEPLADELVDRVFMRAFSGMNIDQELQMNHQRYGDFVGFMAKLAQGDAGAGAFFRPGGNEAAQPGNGGFASSK